LSAAALLVAARNASAATLLDVGERWRANITAFHADAFPWVSGAGVWDLRLEIGRSHRRDSIIRI
jgi:hypothetical protein